MKLKRGILLVLTVIMLAFSVKAAEYTHVYIDECEVAFDETTGLPFIENGRTLVPLRVTMETFGAEVEWDSSAKMAIVRKGPTTVRCAIGENCIYRNNVRIENDAAAVVVSGRTYLPIRVVLEAFGAQVGWDGAVKVTSASDKTYINLIETEKSSTRNYWGIWNSALAQKESGNYKEAINKILSISSVFIETNANDSKAMLFKHLGECHSKLGEFSKASVCFEREAYYWNLAPGMEQSRIDAQRRAKLIKPYMQIYALSEDTHGANTYFGVKHEPENGAYIGAYAEGDMNIYNPYDPTTFYMYSFPTVINKNMAAYLLYMPYGTSLSHYESHLNIATLENKLLQISLEPHNGLDVVNGDDGYLVKLAKDMQNSSCKLMLRFAGEMNDATSEWYYEDPKIFIEKFRIVADIFHKYAPDVPVLWSPNFYPPDTIDDYYPGDEYVDYVGISSYQEYQPETDPLQEGIDRSRWSNQLDVVYSLYGHKKPIVVVEGGVAYKIDRTTKDLTEYSAEHIREFYTYLPIKYPNVKMNFLFASNSPGRNFSLSENSICREAFRNGIQNRFFYDNLSYIKNNDGYYELGNNIEVSATPLELCSYIYTVKNDVSYVIYYINGENAGVSYGIPYVVSVDFSAYCGQNVNVTVKAFNAEHNIVATESVNVKVK